MATKHEKKGQDSIQIKVEFAGQPDEKIEVMAYAFNSRGQLLDQATLKNGLVELKITPKAARGARILIGPPPKERQAANIEQLRRQGAYEPVWKYDPRLDVQKLLPIPELKYRLWFWRKCRVTGKVVKPTDIAGVSYDLPVCHARVHVCEVDPIWLVLQRLPDPLVWRLRDELLVALERPLPIPDPEPEPPFRLQSAVKDVARIAPKAYALTPRPQEVQSFVAPLRALSDKSDQLAVSSPLPIETRAALNSNSLTILKESLLANVKLIYPYLCWFHWLRPYFYRCDELRVLETDAQGRFDTDIWYLCLGDKPDLYFWVEYCIGGAWTTVYKPSIRCHTYWNYVCGAEVTIRVTDPAVIPCGELPQLSGMNLAVVSIGHNVNVMQIDAGSGHFPATYRFGNGADEVDVVLNRAFGGSIEPHVIFGEGLAAAGITHYRWSYRREGTSTWHALEKQVIRHYIELDTDDIMHLKTFLLGPDASIGDQTLFKIPTDNNLPDLHWSPEVNARANTASAYFLTGRRGQKLVADGLYELKLEVFRQVGGSYQRVSLPRTSVQVPPASLNFPVGDVVDVAFETAPNSHVKLDGAGNVEYFHLSIRVDNNPCEAEIYPTKVAGNVAGDCGFIQYGSDIANALLSFHAHQENNYGYFDFSLSKGSSGDQAYARAQGSVGTGPSVIGNYTYDAGFDIGGFAVPSRFRKEIVVSSLIGTCPGGKAAFAENLYVNTLITDGWSDLDYLDARATPKAFALEP